MHMKMLSLFQPTLVFFYFIPTTLQQKDPVRDFCRRLGHQTTVMGNKLYTDGGLVDWNPISTYSQNYSSKSLPFQVTVVTGKHGSGTRRDLVL